jgi:hypothetical protein
MVVFWVEGLTFQSLCSECTRNGGSVFSAAEERERERERESGVRRRRRKQWTAA